MILDVKVPIHIVFFGNGKCFKAYKAAFIVSRKNDKIFIPIRVKTPMLRFYFSFLSDYGIKDIAKVQRKVKKNIYKNPKKNQEKYPQSKKYLQKLKEKYSGKSHEKSGAIFTCKVFSGTKNNQIKIIKLGKNNLITLFSYKIRKIEGDKY